MNAGELFEKAGCNACAVALRGADVQVYCSGGSWLVPAAEWERYQALCAKWRATTVDVQAPSAPEMGDGRSEMAVLESVRRELGRLQTDLAAAGTCLSLDDMADALVSFMRRVKACEEQVAQVLTCGESDGVKQEGGAR